MSRHRNVRSMDYNDEYDGYDDVYGHSVDDDTCISPSDAQQWIFDRARGQQSMSSFIAANEDIEEENEEPIRRDSESFEMPPLSDEEQVRLASCMDEIRNVVGGEAISDQQMIKIILKHNFDFTKSLDVVLNNPDSIKSSSLGNATQSKSIDTSLSKDPIEKDLINNKKKSLHELLQETANIKSKFTIPNKSLIFHRASEVSANDNNSDNINISNNSNNNNNNNIKTDDSKVPQKKFSSLIEMANFHLSNPSTIEIPTVLDSDIIHDNNIKKSTFTIPKFQLNTFSLNNIQIQNKNNDDDDDGEKLVGNLTPHQISMRKIMKIKQLEISALSSTSSSIKPSNPIQLDKQISLNLPLETQSLPSALTSPLSNENFIIDLRTALNINNNNLINADRNNQIQIDIDNTNFNREFQPVFYDCDNLMTHQPQQQLNNLITQHCEIDITSILELSLPLKTNKVSSLGKALCTTYRRRKQLPYVKHEFNHKYTIQKFLFDTPSPDDIISKRLKEFK